MALDNQTFANLERDISDTGEAVNEKKVISPRYGDPFKSLPLVAEEAELKADEVVAKGFYLGFTNEAAMRAYTPSFAETRAKLDDTKKVYRWERTSAEGVTPIAGIWHDTGLSELDQAKNYFNDLASVKAKTLVNSTDFNNVTENGLHKIVSNVSAATMLNCPSNLAGMLEVLGSTATLLIQRYNVFSTTMTVYIRVCNSGTWTSWETLLTPTSADTRYFTTVAKTIANSTDFNTLLTASINKVISNASAATMLNSPSQTIGILEVIAIDANYVIQRYSSQGSENKVFFRSSSAGVWSEWEEVAAKNSINALVNTLIAESSESILDSVTQNDFYGKKYSNSEQNGIGFYNGGVYVGYNSISEKDIAFNTLEARIFNTSSANIEYRVWFGDTVQDAANGYRIALQTNIAKPNYSGICKAFPKSDNGSTQQISLDQLIQIPKNTPFVIVFKAVDFNKFSITYNSEVSGNLENRSFNLSTVASDWSALTSIGNATLPTYVQAGFKLLLTLPQSSSAQVAYSPTIVLPPKIYTLGGLQAHIYPEHLTAEDHTLYEHDVISNVGKQVNRGFWWDVPSAQAAGTHALTYKLFDKQQAKELASASTTVVVGNKAKAGNINVCVIGDSYINAGTITQGLLDLSASDPLKINLIGTRGTGTNKHEGRGGWTIANYATEGQINYQFTVSNVSTVPAINSATYAFSGATFLVQETNIVGGSGTIMCSLSSGAAPIAGASGTLTKSNSSDGDASIAFSDVQAVSGNPFWINGSLNFSQYLTNNSLATPDYVLIQLGVNDSFSKLTDAAVEAQTVIAFPQLDSLISSIKAANSNVKIGLLMAPTYASQDGFGASYGSNYTAFRGKRNIVTWNKKLIEYYKSKESSNVFLVNSGQNVDTIENFPFSADVAVNSRNPKLVKTQNNAVHPSTFGYLQIADTAFAFMKSV